jgi:hypothetical protein
MAFIGTPLDTRNTFQSLQGKRFSGDGSETEFTLDVAPSSVLDIEVFVGNVRQDPNSAYTLSGTTLTFTGAPPSGTNNIYVVHQAKAVGTIGIPDDTISARTLVTADGDNDHILIHDATDGELKKALVPSSTADGFFATSGLSSKDLGNGLHIKTADSGQGSVDTNADELVLEGSAGAGMTILSGTSNLGRIAFGDSGATMNGRVQYDHTNDSLDFYTSGTEHMSIDSTGAVTKPLQPSFHCTKNGTASNVTGDGTVYTIAGWTEVADRNADFNNTSGVFTAPVTGLYLLTAEIYIQGMNSSHADNSVYFYSSNRNYGFLGVATQSASGHTGDFQVNGSVLADMDASDTVSLRIDFRGSSKIIDVHESSKFMGMLLA